MELSNVGKVLRNGTNERPSLQSYGNMYSRDNNIGLSNLVKATKDGQYERHISPEY